jgi:hypothetical protein
LFRDCLHWALRRGSGDRLIRIVGIYRRPCGAGADADVDRIGH